ncbi:hypothetical protein LCGC14_3083750 [marine sediment metagenome]|uniref:Uncharacterized protein n=1 Tax=marine sediment metagenome TaxID=412755 RepID=A0A0F8WCH5_9ZZZZ
MALVIRSPMHKLISKRGMSLQIPRSSIAPNLADPDIYAESSTQLYPLGTGLTFADGRLFRYGKWGATNTTTVLARMVANGNLVPGSAATNGYEGTIDATSDFAVGSTTIILNDTTDRSLNAYEDGMFTVFPSGHFCSYRIAGSEAASSVDDVTILLDDLNGLQTALVVNSTGVTAYPSIFSNLLQPSSLSSGAAFGSAMGLYIGDTMTSGSFGWIQRKGRAWVTPTAFFGDTANERMAQLHSDGTIALQAADATHTVGYLTQMTISGYGDAMIWLTLE